MNIESVAQKVKTKEKTVRSWCEKGYIRGAVYIPKNDDYEIPSSFKKPYRYTSNAKGDAIYKNIVKAVLADCDVVGAMYGMDEDLFEEYVQDLVDAGVVKRYISKATGVEYLRKTLKSSDFSKLGKNKIKDFLKAIKPDK